MRSPAPEKVARVVLGALQSPRMVVRYPAGMDALLFPAVRWCLPGDLYDWLMHRAYERFKPGAAGPSPS